MSCSRAYIIYYIKITMNEIIGRAVSNEICQQGLTPQTLATAMGVSALMIENVCNGNNVETSMLRMLSLSLRKNFMKLLSDEADKVITQKPNDNNL